jgi:hypothetical protein
MGQVYQAASKTLGLTIPLESTQKGLFTTVISLLQDKICTHSGQNKSKIGQGW